eukprot:SAG31_NODE_16_length_36206_cov_27.355728_9_plen_113_part_00
MSIFSARVVTILVSTRKQLPNTKNVKAYAGLDLMLRFSDKLAAMLEMHGGIKFNYDIYCEMFKILDVSYGNATTGTPPMRGDTTGRSGSNYMALYNASWHAYCSGASAMAAA